MTILYGSDFRVGEEHLHPKLLPTSHEPRAPDKDTLWIFPLRFFYMHVQQGEDFRTDMRCSRDCRSSVARRPAGITGAAEGHGSETEPSHSRDWCLGLVIVNNIDTLSNIR